MTMASRKKNSRENEGEGVVSEVLHETVVPRSFNPVKGPIGWWRDSLSSAFNAGGGGQLRRINRMFSGVFRFIRSLPAGRSPKADSAPDMGNFRDVILHWGISEDQVDHVARLMMVESIFFLLLAALGFWGLFRWSAAPVPTVESLMVVVVGSLGFVTRFWRSWCLRRREFIPFVRWIIGLR